MCRFRVHLKLAEKLQNSEHFGFLVWEYPTFVVLDYNSCPNSQEIYYIEQNTLPRD